MTKPLKPGFKMLAMLGGLLILSAPIGLLCLIANIAGTGAAIAVAIFYGLACLAFRNAPSDYPGPLGGND